MVQSSACRSHKPPQLHNPVQGRPAPKHLHFFELHNGCDLQPHFNNCLQALAASGSDVQWGIQLSPLDFHPKQSGEGECCWACRHILQTLAWKTERFACCNRALCNYKNKNWIWYNKLEWDFQMIKHYLISQRENLTMCYRIVLGNKPSSVALHQNNLNKNYWNNNQNKTSN